MKTQQPTANGYHWLFLEGKKPIIVEVNELESTYATVDFIGNDCFEWLKEIHGEWLEIKPP